MTRRLVAAWRFSGLAVFALVYFGAFVSSAYVPVDHARALAWSGCAWLLFWSVTTSLFDRDRAPSHSARVMIALLAFWVAVGIVQSIPLPAAVSAAISPPWKSALAAARSAGLATPSAIPISTAPESTMLALDQTIAALGFFFAGAVLCRETKGRRQVLRILVAGTLAVGAFGLLGLGVRSGDRLSGMFGNPNHFAAFLAIGLPVCGAVAWRARPKRSERSQSDLFMIVAALLVVAATAWMLTLSRGSILTGLLAVGAWLAMEYRRRPDVPAEDSGQSRQSRIEVIVLGVALLALLAFAAVPSALSARLDGTGPGGNLRPRLWVAGLQTFLDAPVLGVGLGGAEFGLNRHLSDLPMRRAAVEVHSDWIQLLCDTGLAGFLGTVLLTGALLKSLHFRPNGAVARSPALSSLEGRALAAGMVAVLLHSAIDFPLRIPLAGFQFLMAAALFTSAGELTFYSRKRSFRERGESERRRTT